MTDPVTVPQSAPAGAGCDRVGVYADMGQAGVAALVAGHVDVAAPMVNAKSLVLLTPQPGPAPQGVPFVSSVTPGVGFTITSSSPAGTANIGWLILEHP